MKTIKHKFYIPIYGCYVTVIVAKNFEKVAKKYDFENVNDIIRRSSAMVQTRKNKQGIRKYIYIQRSSVSLGIIAHEAKHIVNRIFRDRGVELDRFNDEAECYLLQYIVNEINLCINTKNKRKK